MSKSFLFKILFLFFNRILFGKVRGFHRNLSNNHATTQLFKYQKYPSLALRLDLLSKTLIFNVEEVLLKSPSLFPYFMLVAFEAGGSLRAIVLFLLYPLICLVSEETGLKIMVMVCFFGIKKERFKVGRAVLPKFYLEDVGLEIIEVLKRGGKKVAVSKLPQVMVEDFLREYLEIDVVVGRELKVFHGYFVGLIEEKKKDMIRLEEILVKNKADSNMIGISGFNISLDDHQLFTQCEEIYLVGKADKRSWQRLPKQKYPKPLIFHDGRLALRPTPLDAVAIFMWAPFGFILAIFRILISNSLPTNISTPLNAFSGMYLTTTMPKNSYSLSNTEKGKNSRGLLYVCNHRTLLDPVYLNVILNKSVTGVTYSVSRISEMLSPIKTVRLSRNRDQDGRMVESLLNQGDVVVCPEGTTCREPYLLRFSPLFAELGDVIVPVAIDTHVTMFYGTTASGLKCLDPLFCLMNPTPMYTVQFLEKVSGLSKSCSTSSNGVVSKFDVANHVQSEIGKALGFECTNLTRRDKYLILVGNQGKV
ncbi:putative glycerol-3-phosphate acyltransferase 3 [Castanea sativa]|uniref:putative glycerol-3-phosphate acyltransferase 3 n=1 Tax=Castanea sativa TaxID=21020 RepID=UPI003F64998C